MAVHPALLTPFLSFVVAVDLGLFVNVYYSTSEMADGTLWQVFVKGAGAGTITLSVAKSLDGFNNITVCLLRRMVLERWSQLQVAADTQDLRLLFAGKQLEDWLRNGQEATLADYGVQCNSTIHLVFGLRGGEDVDGDASMPRAHLFEERIRKPSRVEKIHNLSDPTLKYTTMQHDAILGESSEEDQPRIVMSCGHAVDANSLTDWCMSLLDSGQTEFHCPAIVDESTNKKCMLVWQYAEVRKAAHLSSEEQEYFESKLSEYAVPQLCNVKECPGCQSYVERCSPGNLRVRCPSCTHQRKRNYDFCWNCCSEWTGLPMSAVKCGSPGCVNSALALLQDAPIVEICGKEVPSLRACPTCGYIVEHNLEGCKFMACCQCKEEFCFLCLESREECLKTAKFSWFKQCSKDPLGRQTEIPVWSRTV